MDIYYLWWILWYFKEFKNAKLDKWQKMLLSLRSNPQTMSPYIHNCNDLCTRTDHHYFLKFKDEDEQVIKLIYAKGSEGGIRDY